MTAHDDVLAVERLLEALVRAAGAFVRCEDEGEILAAAAEALHLHGYMVAVLQLKGEVFVHRVLRHHDTSVELGRKLYGMPIEEVRIPVEVAPGFPEMFETGRGVFHPDMHRVAEAIHPASVAGMMREVLPRMAGLTAPIFVSGVPFGALSVQGTSLTPAHAATVELFARVIGGAMESVRHRRRAEEQVVVLQQLQQALVQRERLAAVGQAAGVLSHEARNPLGAILNTVAVLRRQTGLDEDGRLVLDIAEEEALRLDALVRDLLELARPLEPRLREVDVATLLEETVSGGVRLTIRERLQARADPILLRLAVQNLVRNASQSGAGGVVSVELGRERGFAVLAVEETGVEPTPVDETFDPFSLTRPRGTGLGLAVVKRVIEAQGGAVRARSGGGRLEVMLPLVAPPDQGRPRAV